MSLLRNSFLRATIASRSSSAAYNRSFVSAAVDASSSIASCHSRLTRQQRSVNLIAALRRSYATENRSSFESSEETSTKLPTDATPNAKDAAKQGESSAESLVDDLKGGVAASVEGARQAVGNAFNDAGEYFNKPRARSDQTSPIRDVARSSSPFTRDSTPRQQVTAEEAEGNLYCGNLFFEVTEDMLEKEFARYGTVLSAKIIRDGRQLSKGFGYIKMENISDAVEARDSLNGQQFEGRTLVVQHSVSKIRTREPTATTGPTNPPSRTLFVGNMSYEMSDNDLNDLFKTIKNVLDVRVAIDRRSGQPRGFAHADFTDVASAEAAAELLNGKEFHGRKLRIDFSTTSTK